MPDSLWNFSISVYRRKGVETACLGLQDRLDADVNLLMLCCWCGRTLEPSEWGRIRAEIAPWHADIVGPLRAVRRTLKSRLDQLGDLEADAAALRKRIAENELDAEHIEQRLLQSLARADSPGSLAAAARNLAVYVQGLVSAPKQDDMADLAILLGAAYPDQSAELVRSALERARIATRG